MDATNRTVDVAVIGAGTAGLAAYRAAIARGATAVVIESGPYGTTCARVGCMPSKLLIAAAEAAHEAREAGPFGVHATVSVNGQEVMARVKRERDRFVGFVLEGVERIEPHDRLRGHARFVAPGHLRIDEHTDVHAKSVVVATGSSPFVPPMFDRVRDRLVVNDDVFAWETLPESAAVFGGGVIGLELGQALSRLGVRVRLFGHGGNVGGLTDPVVREAAARAFEQEFRVDFAADVREVRPAGDGADVVWSQAGELHTEHFAAVLVAAGRRPNVAGLGLENAGVVLGPRGLPDIDPCTLQVGTSPLFIAGDANPDRPMLHEAADEGRIAGENAARFPDVHASDRRSLLAVTFTEPQLAIAGATHAELIREGDIVTGEVSFDDQGRSRVMRRNRGALRVYFDPHTARFLGAEIAGPRAEHLGHLLAWAHQAEMTLARMLAMPFYHPVVEEGLRTALRDAQTKMERRSGTTT